MGSQGSSRRLLFMFLIVLGSGKTMPGQDLPPLPADAPPARPIRVDVERPSRADRVTPLTRPATPVGKVEDFLKKAESVRVEVDDIRQTRPSDRPAPRAPRDERAAAMPSHAPEVQEPDPSDGLDAVKARLAALPKDDAKEADAASKALRPLLEERVALTAEWAKVIKDLKAAEAAEPGPEGLAAQGKAELERVRATLDQAAREPDALLPAAFRGKGKEKDRGRDGHVPESALAEMKEAIDATQAELKDWSTRLEKARAEGSKAPGAAVAEARARRDKAQQQLAALNARNAERLKARDAAQGPDARELAAEALANGHLEARIEAERVRTLDLLLSREVRTAEAAALNQQLQEARVRLAQRTLDRMKERYGAMAAKQEQALQQAAAKEQTRADHSDDPLERYRARRAATLLELEARVVTSEKALATSPPPSFEDQHALAERAATDFAGVKKLLDDGKVSHLDALRLNNDFRRLGGERARIIARDLAAAADRLTRAENALSDVELEIAYDARDDRYELESLLEHLPAQRHREATAIFEEFERRHAALLVRRRAALDKLAGRAEATYQEVLRRLRILDDHFGFIRTHMFWVRDEEPIGRSTLAQARRELRQLGRASLRIGAEVADPTAWGRLSGEFLGATLGLLILPWPLYRAHRALRGLSDRNAAG